MPELPSEKRVLVPTKRGELLRGARDTLPLVVGAVPFGIIFGALAIGAGLSPMATQAMSLFVFAGSAQFVAAGLLSQSAGVAIIVLTTFIVNLRHALYSASLAPYVQNLSQRWLLPLGFWLTDETFAIAIKRYRDADASPHKHWYYLGSAVLMYVNWQICTLIGIVAGQQLQGLADLGLEIAMVVSFVGIVVPMLISKPMVACALSAGGVAALLHSLPHQLGLMVGSVVGVLVGYLLTKRMGDNNLPAADVSS
ncbi:MAG: AzlC family ABC transporter permease [Pseudomonadota bacterium]